MKTFKDLEFLPHSLTTSGLTQFSNAKQAELEFENGYGVSVVFGNCFYSNGVDTYEMAILYDGEITYSTELTNDVLGHLTEEEVSEYMVKVQQLK